MLAVSFSLHERGEQEVFHFFGLPFLIEHYQFRKHFGHFFGNQSVLNGRGTSIERLLVA